MSMDDQVVVIHHLTGREPRWFPCGPFRCRKTSDQVIGKPGHQRSGGRYTQGNPDGSPVDPSGAGRRLIRRWGSRGTSARADATHKGTKMVPLWTLPVPEDV